MEKSSKAGFVIKLSCETVQKLNKEEQKSKVARENDAKKENDDAKNPTTKTDKDDFKLIPEINTQLESKSLIKDSSSREIDNINPKQILDAVSNKSNENSDVNIKPDKSEDKSDESDNDVYAQHVSYDGDIAIYTDPTTQQKYTWNKESSCWDPMPSNSVPGRVYSYENDTHIYTEADGSKFFWDDDKKAWIPKVDDEFLAMYQMSYGFVDNTSKNEPKEDKKDVVKKDTGVKRKNDPQWFEQSKDKNTKVYVSNLPLDITEEEFVDLMQKCGLVERDPSSQKMKVKLYMDKEHDCFKGDALCTYIKIESVELALNLLDGSVFKGNKIKVERAQFQLKGEYNPALKPKKKRKKEIEKIKKMQQKLFDWRPEKFIGERSKHERIVIIKNLFHPTDFDKDVQLILDFQQDLRQECSKCGEVRKVVIYDRHPEGVAQITMKESEEADAVIQLINGRWFGKRQITAETWDGRTKYRIAETDADINQRLDKWGRFLEGKEEGKTKEQSSGDVTKESSEIQEDMCNQNVDLPASNE